MNVNDKGNLTELKQRYANVGAARTDTLVDRSDFICVSSRISQFYH